MTSKTVLAIALSAMTAACAQIGQPIGDQSTQERITELREFTAADVSGALGLAKAQGDRASVQCWTAILDRLQSLPAPPDAIGAAYAYQRTRGFRRIIGGDDEIHVACAAMVSDSAGVVRRLIGIVTPGL